MSGRVVWLLLAAVATLVANCAAQDVIDNCRPKNTDTILCVNRQDFCTNLDLDFIFNPDTYCVGNQRTYIDPDYPCSCKLLCVDSIPEGDQCSSSFTSGYPESLCDFGLDCMQSSATAGFTCQRNPAKPCVYETINYETAMSDGTLGPGMLYPSCDDVGRYDSKQCSASSTCYCTDVDGNRLYGEAAYTEKEYMDCQCSKHWQRNDELGLTEGLRCLSNGNLDPLQCVEDFCYCYNTTHGAITQGPYHATMMQLLDCFDPDYHSINYTNPCTLAEKRFLLENPEDPDNIVIGTSEKPNCGLDGFYSSVQPLGLNFFCSDLDGNQIENFAFSASIKEESNCNCATRHNLMKKAGLTSFMPVCCPNGNFEAFQTRGLFAYCVDDNGNQVGDAIAITDSSKLPCAGTICTPNS